VIRQLDRKPFIVGASLGGLIGLLIAGEHPEFVRGLVLVDIVPRFQKEGANRILDFMTARPDGYATLAEVANDIATVLPNRPRTTDMSGLLKNVRMRNDGRYHWHWDTATLSGAHVRDPSTMVRRLETAARRLRTPTLLVRGARSDVVDDEGAASFLLQAREAQLVNIAGADHMVAGDRNDAFNRAVLDFLKEHRNL
jgi:pimeloyl-ACP methyl ester carboxylesterase